MKKGLAILLALIGAAMAGRAVLAAASTVPTFDVEASCRAAAVRAKTPNYVAVCRNIEQQAHDNIDRQWAQWTAADKERCVPASANGGQPTYTELLTCLEMAREARNMRNRTTEPSTVGQAPQ